MSTPAPETTPAAKLRTLAARVRRLACSSRCDPETVTIEKHDIAAALARLARELEGQQSWR
jgi:hypothetical protein